MATADAESHRAYNKTLADYDAKHGTDAAPSDVEEEEKDEDQSAVDDAVDRADVFATKRLVDWGMGPDDRTTASLSPTIHSDAEDSDASSHHGAEEREEEEEEEEYEEEEQPRELPPTLAAPSSGSGLDATASTQEGGEGYRPLFPVVSADQASEVSY